MPSLVMRPHPSPPESHFIPNESTTSATERVSVQLCGSRPYKYDPLQWSEAVSHPLSQQQLETDIHMSSNKVILVTGSITGIGYELVHLLAARGNTVSLASRKEAAGLEA